MEKQILILVKAEEDKRNAELARLQKVIEQVEEWGYGEIIIKIQDGVIVSADETKKHKF